MGAERANDSESNRGDQEVAIEMGYEAALLAASREEGIEMVERGLGRFGKEQEFAREAKV